ncbi:hypothetical protein COB11_03675 [Candidatus Aerophobetes bacterium]|uniref:TerC family protein n=1 Tax=Aerophobetes bacterium TaxID=2030807 RepID=A0A2A4YIB1_UNCAE|nr:MAG: hypothetical protein COB11_03675 [Candidatus Aerophobetes bacterium]
MEVSLLNQTFSYVDIPKVLVLIFLECLLSADNALVLAAIVKPLPKKQRGKALWIGIFSAFVLRAIAIFVAAYLIRYFFVQAIGAIYLFYLAFSFKIKTRRNKDNIKLQTTPPLWKTVLQIEATDFIFAIDSILAALGLTGIALQPHHALPPKMWIVYLGGIIGLVIMRFSVRIFSFFIDRFKRLERASHYLIGWIGIKLGFEALYSYLLQKGDTKYTEILQTSIDWVFWIVTISLFIYGFLPKQKPSSK